MGVVQNIHEGIDIAQYTSLQIITGNPAICYYNSVNNVMFIRSHDSKGKTWGVAQTIDSTTKVGKSLSLQEYPQWFSPSYYEITPIISYFDATNQLAKSITGSGVFV
jgi:hypothetical protein